MAVIPDPTTSRRHRRLRCQKQSVNDLPSYLEARAYLVREPDPTDSRSRRIHWTDRGQRLGWLVAEVANNLELSAAEFLGDERFNEFRRSFADLVAYITAPELN